MNRTAISRTLTVAAATGVASLAFCAPASAMRVVQSEDSGTAASTSTEAAPPADSTGLDPVLTTVAAGGVVVVVGAGAFVLVRRRHHSGDLPHPV
jgi:hypothetical protein